MSNLAKGRAKRRVTQDLHRTRDPEVAAVVLEEIKEEIEHQVEQKKEGRVPGRIVGGSKTTWTFQDFVDREPIFKWTPLETVPLCINGVNVNCYRNIEMHAPQSFYDLYQRYMSRKYAGLKVPEGIIVSEWPGRV